MNTSENPSGSESGDLDLSQFHSVFFEEAAENLATFESLLLEADADSVDSEQLNAIFRCAHSIKGGAATFGFGEVTDLTHVMETLLDKLRRAELGLNREMIDTLLESGDALRTLLARRSGESDVELDARPLLMAIEAHSKGGRPAAPIPAAAASDASAPTPVAPEAVFPGSLGAGERRLRLTFREAVPATTVADVISMFDEVAGLGRVTPDRSRESVDGQQRAYLIETASTEQEISELFAFHVNVDEFRLQMIDTAEKPELPPVGESAAWGIFEQAVTGSVEGPAHGRIATAKPVDVAPVVGDADRAGNGASDSSPGQAPSPGRQVPAETATLRVGVDKVDNLINLVGELVITQAMLAQSGQELDPIKHQSLMTCLAELERNTRLMQESVMAIRMIPMAVVFSRFPRMVRDLEKRLNKKIGFRTVGEATELDKGMIEKITDPLTHLVRNAAEHGIEPPHEREAAGKNPVGQITLAAEHRGGQICIEVRDDGRGLSREKLMAKAIERGMPVTDQMSDQDVWGLIMEPGFSTAEALTDVSGRGVGMDVVKKNIQSLGGSVDISSAFGFGTTISVRLPLTLAIMDGMSVGIGDNETYILPLAAVVESINLNLQQVRTIAGEQKVLQLRGEYIPVVRLEDVVRYERSCGERVGDTVVIVESDGRRAALAVDELIGQHQVVVKNLESNYRKIDGISGATILGDGRVALILDIAHIIRRARH
ncbi:MAG: chemotaxis protein CheW [Burkholderiaceae bacterium]